MMADGKLVHCRVDKIPYRFNAVPYIYHCIDDDDDDDDYFTSGRQEP
jgi:hypothetical protein